MKQSNRTTYPTSECFVSALIIGGGDGDKFLLIRMSCCEHLRNLVSQELNRHCLGFSWIDPIMNAALAVVEHVQPDVRRDADSMDIRNYVRIKKIVDNRSAQRGHRRLALIHGLVFSHNVADKAMNNNLEQPRILLLRQPLEWQRVEGRFTALEPQLMQEQEYLRVCVARVAALQPTLLLVQRTVARPALRLLLEAGITLVQNVSAAVMERVARFTQADIVASVEQLGTGRYCCALLLVAIDLFVCW